MKNCGCMKLFKMTRNIHVIMCRTLFYQIYFPFQQLDPHIIVIILLTMCADLTTCASSVALCIDIWLGTCHAYPFYLLRKN